MLITLFVFEIIIVGLTIFTTHMVEHKFKTIEMSLPMYHNKRTYKTKANMEFIESIVNIYQKLALDTDEEPDLESAIKRKLQHEYIGKFPYISVKNVAIKSRHLMWAILGLEFFIAWINQEAYTVQMVVLITASLLLTIIMAFYGIIRGLDERSEALIDEVIHYIRNVYPLENNRVISDTISKQRTTISLKEHKVKRDGLKVNDKQGAKGEQYCELKKHNMQRMALHKEENIKNEEAISSGMNKQNYGQDNKEDYRENNKEDNKKDNKENNKQNQGDCLKNASTKLSVEGEINSERDQLMKRQDIDKQDNKKNAIELSAKDIAKLLEHL